MTFTPANWDAPQTVTVSAAQDADAADGAAAFLLQSAGLGTTTVTATEADDDVTTPTIVTLADAADAHVRDGSYATQNFGQATTLEVKNSAVSGYRRQAFVRFDLTGVGSATDITSAKVRLFGNILSTEAASLPVGIYSVANTTWGENAITSNTAPAAGAAALTTRTVSGTTGTWYEFDVTNYLKQQKAGGATAVAFALKGTITSEGFVGFNSDEAMSNKPQLLVQQAAAVTQALVVVPSQLTVPEGHSSSFSMSLATEPNADVVVTIMRQSGDTSLTAAPASVTFTPADWNIQRQVTISAAQDADTTNGSAVFSVSAAGIAGKTVTATEQDDDAAGTLPALSINDVRQNEGNSGKTPFVFTVTRSGNTGASSSVQYRTQYGNSSTGPADLAAQAGSISFAPGQTSRQVTILVNGDTGLEVENVFYVDLFNPVGATIADAQGVGTIVNDD